MKPPEEETPEAKAARKELARALRGDRRSKRGGKAVDDAAAQARRVIAGNRRFTPPAGRTQRRGQR